MLCASIQVITTPRTGRTPGVKKTCSAQPTAVSAPLAEARARNRAGIIACIERAIAQGELPVTTDTKALAAMFDSFLLGLTALARDEIPHAVMDASVTQVMAVWDALSATTAR
ncbi:TetR family transcriptional regulator C-terminal domain-containing protein [Pseudomonas sp. ANT_J12]|uniref:TetR family transcriptional regulator C-terminal domain-containing protein n=1 Tax=Pseudomonas sp. ANT_J12 TaxID=2597351 RepID=UPI0015B3BD69